MRKSFVTVAVPCEWTLSVNAATSLEISLWLNCLDFLIHQASFSKNGSHPQLMKYDASDDPDAPNQPLNPSANRPLLLNVWKVMAGECQKIDNSSVSYGMRMIFRTLLNKIWERSSDTVNIIPIAFVSSVVITSQIRCPTSWICCSHTPYICQIGKITFGLFWFRTPKRTLISHLHFNRSL